MDIDRAAFGTFAVRAGILEALQPPLFSCFEVEGEQSASEGAVAIFAAKQCSSIKLVTNYDTPIRIAAIMATPPAAKRIKDGLGVVRKAKREHRASVFAEVSVSAAFGGHPVKRAANIDQVGRGKVAIPAAARKRMKYCLDASVGVE